MGAKFSRRSKILISYIPRYIIAIVVSICIIAPILVAIMGGFKTSGELLNSPFTFPKKWIFENYGYIFQLKTFWKQLLNSSMVMIGTVCLSTFSASLAAFVFARMNFRGRDTLFNVFMIGLLFPIMVAILPLYILMRQLDLINRLMGLILVESAFQLSGMILILRSFFRSLPRELEDATYIDGGTSFTFFRYILLPLSKPALATNAALAMVFSWNQLFLPLLVLNDASNYTLPLGTMQFFGQYTANWSRLMAFIVLAMLPAVVFYLLAERYIISGLTGGAIKG
ncbi:MAG: carbohydrate ABC transporter permease [Anaerolineales bacterium]|nr:carbohydrate ABC transporter permease [Anaerolineales bacterium]